MSKEESHNIFEEAGKILGKKAKKSHAAKPSETDKGKESTTSLSIEEIMKTIETKKRELDDKTEKVASGFGIDLKDADNFFQLTSQANDLMKNWKEKREEFAKKLTQIFGGKSIKNKETREVKKIIKKRKGKMLGARKKWLKMD